MYPIVEPLSFKDLKRNVLNLISERREILNEKIDWIQMMIHLHEDVEPLASWRPTYEQRERDNERLLKEKEECSNKKNEWLKDKEKLLNERDASYEQLLRFQEIFFEDKKQWLKEKEERDEWYSGSHNESKEAFTTAPKGPSYEQLKQENENLLNQEMNWIKEELECLEEKDSLLRLSGKNVPCFIVSVSEVPNEMISASFRDKLHINFSSKFFQIFWC